MRDFFLSLQRITSSDRYIPEIDGLRFVAILSVVLYHISAFLAVKSVGVWVDPTAKSYLVNYLDLGHLGVQLFFAISGFILSYPFISYYLNGGQKPNIKRYFTRRVTRLEPPYIVSILVFALILYLFNRYPLREILLSSLASLTYCHNIINPQSLPWINFVLWSLEIEVQFYILTPLLVMVYRFGRPVRIVAFLLITTTLFYYNTHFAFQYISILNFLPYFLIGFILAELYLLKHLTRIPNLLAYILTTLSFSAIWITETLECKSIMTPFMAMYIQLVMILTFYYFVLFNRNIKQLFSNKAITIIGGMCYSIYLLHYGIISFFGNPLVRYLPLTNSYFINFWIYTTLLLIPITGISILYYKFIEQPCMERDWYKKLYARIIK